ncbi:MAG: hypothetical protein FKGGLIKP_00724 [Sodalis sp. Fse]|nr:MAG: hypothetical protein FKGGLIKP_00724 [Sodalis sp. Fse]UVK79267.1 MAG: hypothetical protein IGNPGNKH_00757 [Sodalis sp. Ffu]
MIFASLWLNCFTIVNILSIYNWVVILMSSIMIIFVGFNVDLKRKSLL